MYNLKELYTSDTTLYQIIDFYFSFKTVLLPVSRNLQCQAFWPVIFMWYFGPELRPIFKRKGLEEVFGKIRKILVGLIEDF